MAQKQSGSPRPGQKESNTADNHAHDRLVFLFASFIVGQVHSVPSRLLADTILSRVCKLLSPLKMETILPEFSLHPLLKRAIHLSS